MVHQGGETLFDAIGGLKFPGKFPLDLDEKAHVTAGYIDAVMHALFPPPESPASTTSKPAASADDVGSCLIPYLEQQPLHCNWLIFFGQNFAALVKGAPYHSLLSDFWNAMFKVKQVGIKGVLWFCMVVVIVVGG